MATISSVIGDIKNRPENISPQIICMWVSELDKKISQELMHNNDFTPYRFPEDAEKELIVKSPHDNIYKLYVYAMIDFFCGELAKYSASALLFEEVYAKYKKDIQMKEGIIRMKNGKKPTRAQKMLMTKWHLNYENWLVVKDTSTEMVIVHRATGRTRTINK